MKLLPKILLASLGFSLISSAFASDAYYLSAKPNSTAPMAVPGTYATVILSNHTAYSYHAYATFQGSGKSKNLVLGPQGAPSQAIEYDVDYPDYEVCLHVVRDIDGQVVPGLDNQCYTYSQTVNINPPARSGAMPMVSLS